MTLRGQSLSAVCGSLTRSRILLRTNSLRFRWRSIHHQITVRAHEPEAAALPVSSNAEFRSSGVASCIEPWL